MVDLVISFRYAARREIRVQPDRRGCGAERRDRRAIVGGAATGDAGGAVAGGGIGAVAGALIGNATEPANAFTATATTAISSLIADREPPFLHAHHRRRE